MQQNEQEKKQSRLCGQFHFHQPVAQEFSLMEQDLEILTGASIMMLCTRLIPIHRGIVIAATYLFIWLMPEIGHILPPLIPLSLKRRSLFPVHQWP
jgi:hypothetical protein